MCSLISSLSPKPPLFISSNPSVLSSSSNPPKTYLALPFSPYFPLYFCSGTSTSRYLFPFLHSLSVLFSRFLSVSPSTVLYPHPLPLIFFSPTFVSFQFLLRQFHTNPFPFFLFFFTLPVVSPSVSFSYSSSHSFTHILLW